MVLTYMFTVPKLIDSGVLHQRFPLENGQVRRKFYFTKFWQDGVLALPAEIRVGLTHKPSVRAVLEALVDDYVSGRPRAELVRPKGSGMDPPFQRMWAPGQAVVEMRTNATRTFGFFRGENEFVAVVLATTEDLKKRPDEPDSSGQKVRYAQQAQRVEALIGRMDSKEVDLRDVEQLVTDC